MKVQLDQSERELYPDVHKFIELEEFITANKQLDLAKICNMKRIFDKPAERIELQEIVKTCIISRDLAECVNDLVDPLPTDLSTTEDVSFSGWEEIQQKWKENALFAPLFAIERPPNVNEPASVSARHDPLVRKPA